MFSPSVRNVLTALCLSAISASAAPGLTLSTTGANSVVGVDNLEVSTTLTNTGDETLKILNDPSSVLNSKYATNSFAIYNTENVSPLFDGVKVKYVPEAVAAKGSDSSFTILAPGESVTVLHNLGDAYNFTNSGEASYTIAPLTNFHVVDEAGKLSSITAKTADTHTAKLKGTLAVARRSSLSKRATYNGCTSARQTLLVSAASGAQSYAQAASTYLTSNTASTARFVKWFGTYTTAHHTTVATHYSNMLLYPYATAYQYDCTCTDSDVYAYVYPSQFGTIYLCGYYWQTTTTGTDSRAGTLVHESSHFTKIGSTQDYAYGQTAAASLAVSNSANAIENADSHEYFAENNPTLA